MVMQRLDDWRGEDGRVDWAGMSAAEVARGERCTRCRAPIFFSKSRGPTKCLDCKSLDTTEEVQHGTLIRCPACGETDRVEDFEDGDLYEEGEHEVTCHACDHDYTVSTMVQYTFTSPAREW
jgi:DNA-directed RNA polymerase subunit RPC12/RpoP